MFVEAPAVFHCSYQLSTGEQETEKGARGVSLKSARISRACRCTVRLVDAQQQGNRHAHAVFVSRTGA